jgi:hypothetical protein
VGATVTVYEAPIAGSGEVDGGRPRPAWLELPGELAAALVDVLAELTDVARSRVADTGSYSYRFAELADVLDVVRPVLHAHGLGHVQLVDTEPVGNGVQVSVRTMIVHHSGSTFASPPIRLAVLSTDAQRVGSAITYARRYSLMATLGIAGEDDDGQTAGTSSPPSRRESRAAATATAPPPPATYRTPEEAQARELLNAAPQEVRTAIQRAFREHFGVSLSNLGRDRHAEALSFVTEQLAVPADDLDAAEATY